MWYGRRVTNEIEKLCTVIDSVIREYHLREASDVSNNNSFGGEAPYRLSIPRNNQNIQWLMESLNRSTMDLYESAITMLESAIQNMEEAQSKLTQ